MYNTVSGEIARIAVVGSYGVGLTMRVPRMPGPGETLAGGRFSLGPGGKGSNQAIGARRLGADVALLTIVGDDDFGCAARALWDVEGLDVTAVVTTPGATMTGVILVEASGENRIILASGVLESLTPAHVDSFRSHLQAADLVMVSLEIPLQTALYALQLAHELGRPTLLNPAPAPTEPIPVQAWETIDYLTPNRTEADVLLGSDARGSATERAEALQRRTGSTVVLTLGSEGSIIATSEQTVTIPAVTAKQVIDTTGAGDAFNAAFAVEIASGRSLTDAVMFAARAGAHTVGIAEVIPALPHLADLAPDSNR